MAIIDLSITCYDVEPRFIEKRALGPGKGEKGRFTTSSSRPRSIYGPAQPSVDWTELQRRRRRRRRMTIKNQGSRRSLLTPFSFTLPLSAQFLSKLRGHFMDDYRVINGHHHNNYHLLVTENIYIYRNSNRTYIRGQAKDDEFLQLEMCCLYLRICSLQREKGGGWRRRSNEGVDNWRPKWHYTTLFTFFNSSVVARSILCTGSRWYLSINSWDANLQTWKSSETREEPASDNNKRVSTPITTIILIIMTIINCTYQFRFFVISVLFPITQ